MNSFNHYAYGAIGEWLYNNVAGILCGEAGYKHTVIQPHVGDLASARASYHSMYGPIASAWRREAGRFTLDVVIPPNTTATVHVPLLGGKTVSEGEKPATDAPGVKLVRMDAESAVYEVGAGELLLSRGGVVLTPRSPPRSQVALGNALVGKLYFPLQLPPFPSSGLRMGERGIVSTPLPGEV